MARSRGGGEKVAGAGYSLGNLLDTLGVNVGLPLGMDKLASSLGVNAVIQTIAPSILGPIAVLDSIFGANLIGDLLGGLLGGLLGPQHTERPEAPDGTHWWKYPCFWATRRALGLESKEGICPDEQTYFWVGDPDLLGSRWIQCVQPVEVWGCMNAETEDAVLLEDSTNLPIVAYRQASKDNPQLSRMEFVGFTAEGWGLLDMGGTALGQRLRRYVGKPTISYADALPMIMNSSDRSYSEEEAQEIIDLARNLVRRTAALNARRSAGALVLAGGSALGVALVIKGLLA